MTEDEFNERWGQLLSKCSPEEQELLETTIAGAEVNYTALYVVIAFLLGNIGGYCLAMVS